MTGRVLVWIGMMVLGWIVTTWSPAWAGKLEDLLLENKQITLDQWVQLKAEEEKRQAKEFEESRSVGDVPVRERWYEKISIRGYAQFRQNFTLNNDFVRSPQGDQSIDGNNSFSVRRARLIISGQPHERVFFYIQPEFANTPLNANGSPGHQNVEMRDFFADLFLTENKEWRIRAGQSKVPFGFQNMQSSQNRLTLDRDDATNSAVPNERDVGLFLYYTPTKIRELFRRLVESGLKGSGDYGMLGLGVFNGQGPNTFDANKSKHVIFHSMVPYEFPNGQVVQVGMDAYTGEFNVPTTPTTPNPSLGQAVTPILTNNGNYLDERVAWHVVLFPQPFGFQAEYTIGRGPQLNTTRTQVEVGSLRGGYLQFFYNYRCDTYCEAIFPFFRVQEYFGGQKYIDNTPRQSVREWEFGLEYQFNRALELTVEYTWTQRNMANPLATPSFGSADCLSPQFNRIQCVTTPYQLQSGNLLRFQLQWSF
jgi:hypothetical protein